MEYAYYTADVFTNTIFQGAQIAVLPHALELDNSRMQLIARELNLTATVFVFPSEEQTNTFRMRIFSPLAEIQFAGHPIIATAHVLASIGDIDLSQRHNPIVLVQNTGPIDASITQENGQPVFVQFTTKNSPVVDRFVPTEQELADFLSIEPADIDTKKFTARMASCGFPYLIVPVKTYAAVRKARFKFSAWSESIAPSIAAQEIFLFTGQTPGRTTDFHGRLLGPNIGVNEDPPIGSVMPAFTGYLCSHEHIRKGTYIFSIDRGDEKGRRSVLNLEMDNKQKAELTIRVGGGAVMVSEGKMRVPDLNSSPD